MDPDATLKQAIEAIEAEDHERAEEYLGYYAEWRKKMGFEPKVSISGDTLALLLRHALCC